MDDSKDPPPCPVNPHSQGASFIVEPSSEVNHKTVVDHQITSESAETKRYWEEQKALEKNGAVAHCLLEQTQRVLTEKTDLLAFSLSLSDIHSCLPNDFENLKKSIESGELKSGRPLEEKSLAADKSLDNFLKQEEQRVFLLWGEAGSGKTVVSLQVTQLLLERFQQRQCLIAECWLPLYYPLSGDISQLEGLPPQTSMDNKPSVSCAMQ